MTVLKFSYPFDIRISKNRMWKRGRLGHLYLACSDVMENMKLVIRNNSQVNKIKFNPEKKVSISLMVYKPNHQSDAINFLDVICDCIATALDLNDRWFEVKKIGWEIDKKNPRFEISVSQ